MADLTTYGGLCSAIADWLARDDLAGVIPNFVRLAELRIDRELRLRCMERRSTLAIEPGQGRASLPNRRDALPDDPDAPQVIDWDVFMEMRDLSFAGRTLRYAPSDDYVPEQGRSGEPDRYTIIGSELFLMPVPSRGGELVMAYYAEVPPLGPDRTENAVLRQYPDLYLYGALLESVPYTRGSSAGEIWAAKWAETAARINRQEQRARFTAQLTMKRMGTR